MSSLSAAFCGSQTRSDPSVWILVADCVIVETVCVDSKPNFEYAAAVYSENQLKTLGR